MPVLKQTSKPLSNTAGNLGALDEHKGWREKRRREMELNASETSFKDESAYASEEFFTSQTENRAEIPQRSSYSSDTDRSVAINNEIREAAHALLKGFNQDTKENQDTTKENEEEGSCPDDPTDSSAAAYVPDADHRQVRIHPGLIVMVVENLLNFEKDEEQGMVEEEDIWYSKNEIAEFRVQSNEEEYQNDLKTGQDFMQSLAHDENSRREEAMQNTIGDQRAAFPAT